MSAIAGPLPPSAKALHSWSLFRTLGRYVAPGSMPSGAMEAHTGEGLALIDLPAAFAEHGYRSAQLCHFYLRSRDPGYLDELRSAFAEAEVDSSACSSTTATSPTRPTAEAQLDWLSSWIETAEHLQPTRVRIPAGKQPPTAETLAASADASIELADRHAGPGSSSRTGMPCSLMPRR